MLLKKGCTGEEVRQLQNKLIALGYSCGSAGADGDFGQGTYDAVVRFQREHDLEADGDFGDDTERAVIKFQEDHIIEISIISSFIKGVVGRSTLEIINKKYDELPRITQAPALNAIELKETEIGFAKILGISSKFEQKYILKLTPRSEIWYKLSQKTSLGGSNVTVDIADGRLNGAGISGKAFERVFSLSASILKKKFNVQISEVLAKFDVGTFRAKVHDFKLTPNPEITFTVEFEHNGIDSDGRKYTAYHAIDIIIKDPDFWKNVEGAAMTATMMATMIATITALVILVALMLELIALHPESPQVIEKVAVGVVNTTGKVFEKVLEKVA